MLVGSPGMGNFANRVPPRPAPQLGTATEKLATFAVTSQISTPRRASCRPRLSKSSASAPASRAFRLSIWSCVNGSSPINTSPVARVSAREGLRVSAIYIDHVRGRLGRRVRCEEPDGFSDVLGQDVALQHGTLAIELLEFLSSVDAVGAGAVLAP